MGYCENPVDRSQTGCDLNRGFKPACLYLIPLCDYLYTRHVTSAGAGNKRAYIRIDGQHHTWGGRSKTSPFLVSDYFGWRGIACDRINLYF